MSYTQLMELTKKITQLETERDRVLESLIGKASRRNKRAEAEEEVVTNGHTSAPKLLRRKKLVKGTLGDRIREYCAGAWRSKEEIVAQKFSTNTSVVSTITDLVAARRLLKRAMPNEGRKRQFRKPAT